MFSCTRTETRLIMDGKSCGVVRRYAPDQCPHKAGNEIVFTSQFLPWRKDTQSVPFARGMIVSVRPGNVSSFRKDKTLAGQDGYANGEVWLGHLRRIPGYESIGDDAALYHITFRLDEVDKNAGRVAEVNKK